jgi:uncharacterized OB-fold protein
MAEERVIPAPSQNPETEPYYRAFGEGRFLVPVCKDCGKAHWYPRFFCPWCGGETEPKEPKGEGVIYSYSVMRRVERPFALAYVELAEGPCMMTNLVDCDFDALRIGQTVRLVLKPAADGTAMPCFTPVCDEDGSAKQPCPNCRRKNSRGRSPHPAVVLRTPATLPLQGRVK